MRRTLTVLAAGLACLLASCSKGSSGTGDGSTSTATAVRPTTAPTTPAMTTSAARTSTVTASSASAAASNTTRPSTPTSRSTTGPTRSTSSQAVSHTATSRSSTKPSPTTAAATGTQIVTATSQFGDILFDAKNQAIYLFAAEDSSAPACYDECAVAWPPVLTDGKPRAGGAIDAKLLGTTERSDGSTQVTYSGHPLYYYAHEGPGEVTCHNVDEYGGLWLAVQPDGAAVGS